MHVSIGQTTLLCLKNSFWKSVSDMCPSVDTLFGLLNEKKLEFVSSPHYNIIGITASIGRKVNAMSAPVRLEHVSSLVAHVGYKKATTFVFRSQVTGEMRDISEVVAGSEGSTSEQGTEWLSINSYHFFFPKNTEGCKCTKGCISAVLFLSSYDLQPRLQRHPETWGLVT